MVITILHLGAFFKAVVSESHNTEATGVYFNNSLRETIQEEEEKSYMAVPWPELAQPVITSTKQRQTVSQWRRQH